MDIPNPPETERVWLNALEDASGKCLANATAMMETGRSLTPEELVAALNSLHMLDQYCSQYVPTADALSVLGRPALAQRLAQVRQDIAQGITICSDMYRSAIKFRTDWQTLQHDAATAATQGIWQSTMHTQSMFDQMNRMQNMMNEGVPYAQALLLSHLPGKKPN
jgi:hypothetical protein